jgi:hypothetical protein
LVPDLEVCAVAVGIADRKGFAAHPFPAKGDA